MLLSACNQPDPVPQPTNSPLPQPPTETGSALHGLTLDDISGLNDIVASVASLPKKATVRIVFDENVAPTYYKDAVTQIREKAFVMGELLDSQFVKDYTLDQYKTRTAEYLSALNLDIWEVGNEINGEWLGSGAIDKAAAAFDAVKARGGKTALTLYYNAGCYATAQNEMFTWAQARVPERMKQGLDYVLVSYYEDDCENQKLSTAQWQTVFTKLHTMFPNSKLGVGECGTKYSDRKAEYMGRYYSMKLAVPNYVGGYFWWYGRQDLVPKSKPLWTTFASLLSSE